MRMGRLLFAEEDAMMGGRGRKKSCYEKKELYKIQ